MDLYPRTFISPPAVELEIVTGLDGERLIVAPSIQYTVPNDGLLLHTINLFLEIFGECDLVNSALETTARAKVTLTLFPGRRRRGLPGAIKLLDRQRVELLSLVFR